MKNYKNIIKLLKKSNKENILKVIWGQKRYYINDKYKMTANYLLKQCKSKANGVHLLNNERKKVQPIILFPASKSF
jgi:hypothetical protein